jgi:hypothetical protein
LTISNGGQYTGPIPNPVTAVTQLAPSGQIFYQTDQRGYIVSWWKDLFGGFVVHRKWYGLHSRRGASKLHSSLNADQVLSLIDQIEKRRLSHGYSCVSSPPRRSATRPTTTAAIAQERLKDDLRHRAQRRVRRAATDMGAEMSDDMQTTHDLFQYVDDSTPTNGRSYARQ